MSIKTASYLSTIHAASIGLGLLQQLVLAAVFGVSDESGMFFVALAVPATLALIYGDALQYSLLPQLISSPTSQRKILALQHSMRTAIFFALLAFALGFVWSYIAPPSDRNLYVQLLVLLTFANLGSMWAAAAVIWLQSERKFVVSSFVHFVPAPLGIAAAFLSKSLSVVAIALVIAAAIQLIILLLLSRSFACAFIRAFFSTEQDKGPRAVYGFEFVALIIAAAVPSLTAIDRIAQSTLSIADAASASYGWAVSLGLANVLSRGPNILMAVEMAGVRGRRQYRVVMKYPAIIFLTSILIALLGVYLLRHGVFEELPSRHRTTANRIGNFLMAQLGCLPALATIPLLSRIVAASKRRTLVAGIVIAEIGIQVALVAGAFFFAQQLMRYTAPTAIWVGFTCLVLGYISISRETDGRTNLQV